MDREKLYQIIELAKQIETLCKDGAIEEYPSIETLDEHSEAYQLYLATKKFINRYQN